MSTAGFVAFIASALVIISAAYIGDIQRAIASSFPGRYRLVVGALIAIAIAAGFAAVASRIREHRTRRYGMLALALAGAAGYMAAFRTGDPDTDVVEAFHFVEYGLLAVLFHRAWRGYSDVRRLVFPLLAGLTVGIIDETFQWFLASRVGEAHDVALDLAAVAFGLLVAVALDPPRRPLTLGRGASRQVAAAALAVLALFAAFVNAVHVGYEIHDPEIGVFRSRHSAETLRQMASERTDTWRSGFPATSRFAREDHYRTEALWHVRERNEAGDRGDTLAAWRENRILEKFYAPLLEVPAISGEYRWSSEQRALMADAAARAHGEPYVSEAQALPIYAIN